MASGVRVEDMASGRIWPLGCGYDRYDPDRYRQI